MPFVFSILDVIHRGSLKTLVIKEVARWFDNINRYAKTRAKTKYVSGILGNVWFK